MLIIPESFIFNGHFKIFSFLDENKWINVIQNIMLTGTLYHGIAHLNNEKEHVRTFKIDVGSNDKTVDKNQA